MGARAARLVADPRALPRLGRLRRRKGPSPVVAPDAPLDTVAQTVGQHGVAVVVAPAGNDGSTCLGIVTQADLDVLKS